MAAGRSLPGTWPARWQLHRIRFEQYFVARGRSRVRHIDMEADRLLGKQDRGGEPADLSQPTHGGTALPDLITLLLCLHRDFAGDTLDASGDSWTATL